ncbi:hypothetical protein EAO74_05285 [Streptomyces sp. gb1(2016)]|uniref:Pierisin-like domain-containing protein n=1 Tax=Streptomyces sp. gb1(2016) TaxID=1828321 RepID=A0A652LA99_9ACTN|nr:hypothetical protein EAO74_05285 [Streptomyces sp. gb1(2016)]
MSTADRPPQQNRQDLPQGEAPPLPLRAERVDRPNLAASPPAFVSTTRREELNFLGAGTGENLVFRFRIRAPGGIDINRTFGEASPLAFQSEVSFPGGIRPEFIEGGGGNGPDGGGGNGPDGPLGANDVPSCGPAASGTGGKAAPAAGDPFCGTKLGLGTKFPTTTGRNGPPPCFTSCAPSMNSGRMPPGKDTSD